MSLGEEMEADSLKYYDNIFKKMKKCMKTEVNLLSVTWTRKWFHLIWNDVLENVLVLEQFSSKLSHGT